MIVGFLEIALAGKIILVVFVRWIGRCVAAGRNDFDDEQRVGRAVVLRHDVGDITGVGSFAAHHLRMDAGRDQSRGMAAAAWRGADRQLDRRLGAHDIMGFRWRISRPGRPFKRAHALAYHRETLAADLDGSPAGNEHKTHLARARFVRQDFARAEAMKGETDIGPVCDFRRNLAYEAFGDSRFQEQWGHCCFLSPRPAPSGRCE